MYPKPIRLCLLTWIKINVSVINAEERPWLFTNARRSFLTPSEPFVTEQCAEDDWANMRLISDRNNSSIFVCSMCVINLREIALSPTVLDSNTLSAININIHQTLNIFPHRDTDLWGLNYSLWLFADRKRKAWEIRNNKTLNKAKKQKTRLRFVAVYLCLH